MNVSGQRVTSFRFILCLRLLYNQFMVQNMMEDIVVRVNSRLRRRRLYCLRFRVRVNVRTSLERERCTFIATRLMNRFIFPSRDTMRSVLFSTNICRLRVSTFLFQRSLFIRRCVILCTFSPNERLYPYKLRISLSSNVSLLSRIRVPIVPPRVTKVRIARVRKENSVLSMSFHASHHVFFW